MTKFNSGDQVKLKSGGPQMTVSHHNDDDDMVWCKYWNEDSKKMEMEGFTSGMLEKI